MIKGKDKSVITEIVGKKIYYSNLRVNCAHLYQCIYIGIMLETQTMLQKILQTIDVVIDY